MGIGGGGQGKQGKQMRTCEVLSILGGHISLLGQRQQHNLGKKKKKQKLLLLLLLPNNSNAALPLTAAAAAAATTTTTIACCARRLARGPPAPSCSQLFGRRWSCVIAQSERNGGSFAAASDLILLSTQECWDGSLLFKFGTPEEYQSRVVDGKDDNFLSSSQTEDLLSENLEVMLLGMQCLGSNMNAIDSNENKERGIVLDYPQEFRDSRIQRCTLAAKDSSEQEPSLVYELPFQSGCLLNNSESATAEERSLINSVEHSSQIDNPELQFSTGVAKGTMTVVSDFNLPQEEVEALVVPSTQLQILKSTGNSRLNSTKQVEDECTLSTNKGVRFDGLQKSTPYQPVINELRDERTQAQEKILSLSSGAAVIPHPAKVATGGEDAFFIEGSSWVGVADGVGSWTRSGIDSGYYARELMWNCAEAVRGDPGKQNPKIALEKAFRITKAVGSSTALVAALYKNLFVVNVGDSGFLLIRGGEIVAKSIPMLHAFNFPYQIGMQSDDASVGEEYEVPVSEGDILVLGTDGLFDNLFEHEIVKIVTANFESGGAPELAAKILVQSAQILGARQEGRSPFSEAAATAGIDYAGGKLDDVTAIVSYFT